MFTIQYLNTNNNEILTNIIIAKKESTARKEAKNFTAHHPEYRLLSIAKS